MYSVSHQLINKGKLADKMGLLDIDGFLMASGNKAFKVDGSNIRKIRVMNKKLANQLSSKKVSQRYNQLIVLLTELLVDDDGSGESCREALNQIEKFRLEIKNKYRDYLLKSELEKMASQLALLQKEANKKLFEIQHQYEQYMNENKRSR